MNERKEIVTVSGTFMLVIMIMMGDLLVLGFGLWWHHMAVFRAELDHQAAYNISMKRIHDLKLDVISRDGVTLWHETGYAKAHPESVFNPEEGKNERILAEDSSL